MEFTLRTGERPKSIVFWPPIKSACLSISFFLNVAPVQSILDLGSKDLSLHIAAHVNLAKATFSGPHRGHQ